MQTAAAPKSKALQQQASPGPEGYHPPPQQHGGCTPQAQQQLRNLPKGGVPRPIVLLPHGEGTPPQGCPGTSGDHEERADQDIAE